MTVQGNISAQTTRYIANQLNGNDHNYSAMSHVTTVLFHFAEEVNEEASKFRKIAIKLRKNIQSKNIKVS